MPIEYPRIIDVSPHRDKEHFWPQFFENIQTYNLISHEVGLGPLVTINDDNTITIHYDLSSLKHHPDYERVAIQVCGERGISNPFGDNT